MMYLVTLVLLCLVSGSAQLELLVSGYNRNLTRTSVSLDSGSVASVHTAAWRVDLNMSWLQLQETVCTFCYQIYAVHEARLLTCVSAWYLPYPNPVSVFKLFGLNQLEMLEAGLQTLLNLLVFAGLCLS